MRKPVGMCKSEAFPDSAQCHEAEAFGCLQDTLKPSLGASRPFPTADCPEDSQAPPPQNAGWHHSNSVLMYWRELGSLRVDTQHRLTGRQVPVECSAHDFGHQHIREGSGNYLQDNRTVGNSRLAHRDVTSVSCK